MILDLYTQREITNCFYLVIPLQHDENSIGEYINRAMIIEQLANDVYRGQKSIEDLFDCVEELEIVDIDDYSNQIETNLNHTLVNIYGKQLCN